MKKYTSLFLFTIFILAVSYSFAVEVSLMGPSQYASYPTWPNICTVYKDSFPGQIGKGKLVFKNGDESGKNRVVLAAVKINGVNILKKYGLTFLVKDLALPVSLASTNSLVVELIGFQRSFITIEIKQDITAIAASVIGSAGGTCVVSDPLSPLNGVELFIPDGAVQNPSLFSIDVQGNEPAVQFPDNAINDGPMISFKCSSTLLEPVAAKIPFSGDRIENECRLFYHFNDSTQAWDLVDPLPGENENAMVVLLRSFSTYAKGRAYISQNTIYSGFRIGSDALRANNTDAYTCQYDSHGPCVGFSLVAEQYFKYFAQQNGVGLKCWWKAETSYLVACLAHGYYYGDIQNRYWFLNKFALWMNLATDTSYLVDSWKIRLTQNNPISIFMTPSTLIEDITSGHSVLVIGWEKVGPSSGKFIVYDNQRNSETREMSYFSSQLKTSMNYIDVGNKSYKAFAYASVAFTDFPYIRGLIASYTKDYTGPCENNLKIAYTSTESDGSSIYVMGLDSSLNVSSSQKIAGPGPGFQASTWSLDGTQVVYKMSDWYSIWIMNADGSQKRTLPIVSSLPVYPWLWSLDPNNFYGTYAQAGDAEVTKFNVTTGQITQLTNVSGYNTQNIDLNASQTKIAYVRGYEGNGWTNQLYYADFTFINHDFNNIVPLTAASPAPHLPKLSPNGSRILFVTARPPSYGGLGIINIDNTGFKELIPANIPGGVGAIAWIDDNRIILSYGPTGNMNLYILDLTDLSHLIWKQLTFTTGDKYDIAVYKR